MRCNRGFTLLEVLVALTVLAITLSAGYASVSRASMNTDELYDRLLGHWAAMNTKAELEIGALAVDDTPLTREVIQLGRHYTVIVTPATLNNEPLSAHSAGTSRAAPAFHDIEVTAVTAPARVLSTLRMWQP